MTCFLANGQTTHKPVKKTNRPQEDKWVSIFNGKDLTNWVPKVTGYKAGENPLDGFVVEDSMIRVDYTRFNRFNGRFGHLFYKEKLSSYILHLEYRFTGELLPDAPSYCFRNSGVMIHSQSPESMEISQNWPVSLECQLLGSSQQLKQTTGNVCTPGTTVFYQGKFTNEHCISSNSGNFYNGEWVSLDIIVHGGKSILHVINGDTVLKYSLPQVGGMLLPASYPIPTGKYLEDGYIALQAEGQSIDFRRIRLKILHEKNDLSKVKSQSKPGMGSGKGIKKKGTTDLFRLVDNFDTYTSNEELNSKWTYPGHGGKIQLGMDSLKKEAGRFGLKCAYTIEKSGNNFYCPITCSTGWNFQNYNGLRFWFKPDGSGRELTFELNLADSTGKDIHDFWGYNYKTEKGDTSGRVVAVPFFNLIHNTENMENTSKTTVFQPGNVIKITFFINGKTENPGSGVFYLDEIAGAHLQF